MQMEINEEEGVTIISLVGRMDAVTAPDFTECCREVMEKGAYKIIVDLNGIAYMSSAGLRSILTVQKTGTCPLIFCSPQPMVADIFRISGFTRILTICATREEARAHAKG